MTLLALLAFALELITPQIESTAHTVVMMESSRVVAGWRLYSVADRLFQADPLVLTDPVNPLASEDENTAWSDSILTLVGPDTGGAYSVGIDPVPVGERRYFAPNDSIDRVVGVADIQSVMSTLYRMRTMSRDRGRTQATVLGSIDDVSIRVVVDGALPLQRNEQAEGNGRDGDASDAGSDQPAPGDSSTEARAAGGTVVGEPTDMELEGVESGGGGAETSVTITTIQIVPVPGNAWLVVAPDQSTTIVVMPETLPTPSRNPADRNPRTSR